MKKRGNMDYKKERDLHWFKSDFRINWLNFFAWIVFVPVFAFFSWYGLYKLVMWVMYG